MPLDAARLRLLLPDRSVHYFDTVSTTMREAARLAEQGCARGTLVVADEQTSGQGRHGRAWHSPRSAGIYLSMVLEPHPVLTLALGLSVAEAIAGTCPVECDLRWPNDVLIAEKKVAGILVQLQGPAAIAGIGVNVNCRTFPPEIAPLATSLCLETGRECAREHLIAAIVESVERWCGILYSIGRRPILEKFASSSTYALGKRVRVEQESGLLMGTTVGLDASGFLLVRRDDGSVTTVIAGGVRPA